MVQLKPNLSNWHKRIGAHELPATAVMFFNVLV